MLIRGTLMECSEPGTFRDDELLVYLDGAPGRTAVAAHLAHCPSCSQKVARYRQLEQQLTGKLYRWDCPSSQVLGEYHLGLLGNQECLQISQHLSACVLCAAELATLSHFLEYDSLLVERGNVVQDHGSAPVLSHNHHEVPVPTIVGSAWQVVERLQGRAEEALVGVRSIVATLLSNSPQLAPQRDVVAQGSSWPRRYMADDVLISLQLERDPHAQASTQMQLLGLVTRTGGALEAFQGVPVLLREQRTSTRPEGAVYTQHIDDLGNFLFSALVPALYTLELQVPAGIVIIDPLDIASLE
jgi:hypothetical protein